MIYSTMLILNIVTNYIIESECRKDKYSEIVAYACNCIKTALNFCGRYLYEHTRSPGRHASEYLLISLTQLRKAIYYRI